MDFNNPLGFMASTLTTGSLLPQFLKGLRAKSEKNISSWMLSISCFGILLWLIYGVLIHGLPIIIFNTPSFTMGSGMMVLKIIYR